MRVPERHSSARGGTWMPRSHCSSAEQGGGRLKENLRREMAPVFSELAAVLTALAAALTALAAVLGLRRLVAHYTHTPWKEGVWGGAGSCP